MTSRNDRGREAVAILSGSPPYRWCWWCSRQLRSNKTRHVLQVASGPVWVHAGCVAEAEKLGGAWKSVLP